MRNQYGIFGIAIALILLGYLGSLRAEERIAATATSDGKHVHQAYAGYPIQARFTASANGLSALAIEARNKSDIQPTIAIALTNETDARQIPLSFVQSDTDIRTAFDPQAGSSGKTFLVEIRANDTPKDHALLVPYETDPTKYPHIQVWQNGAAKQGSIAIAEYEQPTYALVFWRWLKNPHQRPLWLGIALIVIGFILHKKTRHSKEEAPKPPTTYKLRPITFIYCLLIIAAILAVYWPATNLFFYSDDVGILARISMLWEQSPLTIFTAHQYQDADSMSRFGFDFWRPVSFSIYPLVLHLLFPTSAALYYFFNILFFALTGCAVFAIAKHILQSTSASLAAVALWAFHSSKLGVVYWWSSIQDIFASLFAMASIALYLRWRTTKRRQTIYLAIAAYAISLLSKEYVIVTPVIVLALELLLRARQERFIVNKKIAWTIALFMIAAGGFLIANTAVLGDPRLPEKRAENQTYALTLSPKAIARNTIVNLAGTAENRLWPKTTYTEALEQQLNERLELWRAKTSGPYYPSIAGLGIFAVSLIVYWHNRSVRNILLFSACWWVLYMGPILLLANDWKFRWLTLATFGPALAIVAVVQRIAPKKYPAVFTLLIVTSTIYGYTTARNEDLSRFYREQSAYTQEAYRQLREYEHMHGPARRIVLVGITEEQQTSLNAYLFRIYAKDPHADIIYRQEIPQTMVSGDAIINMTGIQPYYPESEK